MKTSSPWADWYDGSSRRIFALGKMLWEEFPEVAELAWRGHAPPLRLLCPRGHPILTVTLMNTGNTSFLVVPVHEDHYEAGKLVAEDAGPSRRVTTCATPGCWRVAVRGPDATVEEQCPEHQQPDFIGTRATLDCPQEKCRYHGTLRNERLVKLYVVAVRLGLPDIRLPA